MGSQATAAHTSPDHTTTQTSPVPPGGRHTRYVRLAALPSAVPWARRVLRQILREWQVESVADPAALLVSELVTNAVEVSAGGSGGDHDKLPMIGLAMRLADASLVLEVWDSRPGQPAAQEADVAADHGRGLLLVDALAQDWGHRPADGGKVVWCEVAIPSSAASTSAAGG